MSKTKVGLISLGCEKNLVDSEMILGLCEKCGFEIKTDLNDVDIIIINTCGFITSAKEEAINTIIEMGEYKTKGKCKYLIVMGCLFERYKKELKHSLAGV